MRHLRRDSGFTLIELLIVVAIIFMVTALAIPRLFSARNKANEASAIASIKAIQAAESVYQNTYPDKGYSPTLVNLGSNGSTCETTSSTNACILDQALSSGFKSGYLFDLVGDGQTPDQTYTIKATPQSSSAGECSFIADQTGGISYYNPPPKGVTGSATPGGSGCTGAVN